MKAMHTFIANNLDPVKIQKFVINAMKNNKLIDKFLCAC